jgi:hypothetical protein
MEESAGQEKILALFSGGRFKSRISGNRNLNDADVVDINAALVLP